MPNPVAANDLSPISGSLQTSRISYGVETAGKNYGQNYNSSYWYSDIPNNGQFYTIISDNYTANYYNSRSLAEGGYVEGGLPAVDEYSAPVFWVTPGTSSLDIITTVNGLPDRVGQTPFNSGSQALNWIASSSNYFAVGPDYYAQIDADNLQLYLDANQIISYPTTQSTWYDLSGYGTNGTLINGPTWNSNGWFTFDGADDLVEIPMIPLADFTITQVLNMDNVDNQMPIGGGLYTNGSDYRGYVWFYKGVNQVRVKVDGEVGPNFGVNVSVWADKWISYTATRSGSAYKLYINGQQVDQTYTNSTNQFSVRTIGWGYSNSYAMQGDLTNTLIYPRELSVAEVLQNYYGGPIVTDGLVFAIDAGNLVSYPKSGTSVYNLTGSITSTLTNGPGFSSVDGGTWTFDGTDDYILVSSNGFGTFNSQTYTVEAWVNPSSVNTDIAIFSYDFTSHVQPFYAIQLRITNPGAIVLAWNNGSIFQFLKTSNNVVAPNQWYHIVAIYESGRQQIFVNGILLASSTATDTITFYNQPVWVGRANFGGYFEGDISVVRYYNKALTSDEVLQNYNATK